jgi:hypothetical protein
VDEELTHEKSFACICVADRWSLSRYCGFNFSLAQLALILRCREDAERPVATVLSARLALTFDLGHAIVQGHDLLHEHQYIFVLLLMEPVDFVGELFKLAIKPVGDAIQPVG